MKVRTVYVFFDQRPMDKEPWPHVYQNKELAEKAPHRCSEVVEVLVALPEKTGEPDAIRND